MNSVAPVLLLLTAGCAGTLSQASADTPADVASAAARTPPQATPTATGAPPSSAAAFAALETLGAALVSERTAPSGLKEDYRERGAPALTRVVISGRGAEFLALRGFLAGEYAGFSGERGVLLSLGLAFDDEAHSRAAYQLYVDELESDAGYGFSTRPATLGDDGVCGEGSNPGLGGLQEGICVWRNGNLVLILGGTLSPKATLSVAKGMDLRAD